MRTLSTKIIVLFLFSLFSWSCEDDAPEASLLSVDADVNIDGDLLTSTDCNLLKDVEVSGELKDGTFKGKVRVTKLVHIDGKIRAYGVIEGVVCKVNGVKKEVKQTFKDVLTKCTRRGRDGKCEIIELKIGGIYLDALGLKVKLSEIILDITATSGDNKILGNLLCELASISIDGVITDITKCLTIIGKINKLICSTCS